MSFPTPRGSDPNSRNNLHGVQDGEDRVLPRFNIQMDVEPHNLLQDIEPHNLLQDVEPVGQNWRGFDEGLLPGEPLPDLGPMPIVGGVADGGVAVGGVAVGGVAVGEVAEGGVADGGVAGEIDGVGGGRRQGRGRARAPRRRRRINPAIYADVFNRLPFRAQMHAVELYGRIVLNLEAFYQKGRKTFRSPIPCGDLEPSANDVVLRIDQFKIEDIVAEPQLTDMDTDRADEQVLIDVIKKEDI